MTRRILASLLVLFISNMVHAQDPTADQITDDVIFFNEPVQDTITQRSIYDRWRFYATEGATFIITMEAADGLAPLIGIFGPGGDIIAASNIDESGEFTADAEPNSTIELRFTASESREYAIIATRVGNEQGTTTGTYILNVEQIPVTDQNDIQDVTFRCGQEIATTATTFEFFGSADIETYRISVYGLDGFHPVIRAIAGIDRDLTDCTDDAQQMTGDQFTLPGEGEETITLADEMPENAAQLSLRGGDLLNRVEVTIGSIDGAGGRYMVVIEGFTLMAGQQDSLNVRLGPLASETDLLVYMVHVGSTRLDPLLTWLSADDSADDVVCDDAGRRGCENVPSFEDSGVILNDGTVIIGDRFDAGLRLAPGNLDRMTLVFSSRNPNAAGPYSTILIGELPTRASN